MKTINLKRIWIPGSVGCMSAPYEGEIDGNSIGILYINPITGDVSPESEVILDKLGLSDIVFNYV